MNFKDFLKNKKNKPYFYGFGALVLVVVAGSTFYFSNGTLLKGQIPASFTKDTDVTCVGKVATTYSDKSIKSATWTVSQKIYNQEAGTKQFCVWPTNGNATCGPAVNSTNQFPPANPNVITVSYPQGTQSVTVSPSATNSGTPLYSKRGVDCSVNAVTTPPPAAPTLLLPANGATNVSKTMMLHWTQTAQIALYRVQVSTDAAFTSPLVDYGSLSTNGYTLLSTDQLQDNKKYYWRVNTQLITGTSPWSTVWSFTTAPAGSATGTASCSGTQTPPKAGDTNMTVNWKIKMTGVTDPISTISWTNVINGSVPADGEQTNVTYDLSQISAAIFPTVHFTNNKTLPGQLCTLNLQKPGPAPAAVVAPTNLALGPVTPNGANYDLSVHWDAVPGATVYFLKASTTAGGPYAVVQTTPSTSASFLSVAPGTYYDVVTASNGVTESANSSELTAVVPPNVTAPPQLTSCTATPGAIINGDEIPVHWKANITGTMTAQYGLKWTSGAYSDFSSAEGDNSFTVGDPNPSATIALYDMVLNQQIGAAVSCTAQLPTPAAPNPPPAPPVAPPAPVAPPTPPAFSPTPAAVSTSCTMFKDVSPNDPDCAAIGYVNSIGAMTGNPNGTFGPNALLQRDQVAKIVLIAARLFDVSSNYCSSEPFPDVSSSDWSYQYICDASSVGVVTGYQSGPDKGYYRASRNVTRAEFLAILLRSLGDQVPGNDVASYDDVSAGQWYSGYAAYARQHGLFTGSNLSPTSFTSRREVARVLYALYKQGKIY